MSEGGKEVASVFWCRRHGCSLLGFTLFANGQFSAQRQTPHTLPLTCLQGEGLRVPSGLQPAAPLRLPAVHTHSLCGAAARWAAHCAPAPALSSVQKQRAAAAALSGGRGAALWRPCCRQSVCLVDMIGAAIDCCVLESSLTSGPKQAVKKLGDLLAGSVRPLCGTAAAAGGAAHTVHSDELAGGQLPDPFNCKVGSISLQGAGQQNLACDVQPGGLPSCFHRHRADV